MIILVGISINELAEEKFIKKAIDSTENFAKSEQKELTYLNEVDKMLHGKNTNIEDKINYELNGSTDYAKSYVIKLSSNESVKGIKYVWSKAAENVTESEITNNYVGEITTENNLTGQYYLWTIYENESGEKKIQRSNVFYFDNTLPKEAEITCEEKVSIEKGSIEINVKQVDEASGVNADASKWVLNTTASKIGIDESLYTGGQFKSDTETITVNNATVGEFYLHVLTVDKAANKIETVSSKISFYDPDADRFVAQNAPYDL